MPLQRIRAGQDACDPKSYEGIGAFDFVWLHPPYARQKKYTDSLLDLSNAPTFECFLYRYGKLIRNSRGPKPGGKLAILMGDYTDREWGFLPLVYHTKRLAFEAVLVQKVPTSSATRTERAARGRDTSRASSPDRTIHA